MYKKDFCYLLLGTLLISLAYGLFFTLAAFVNHIGGNEGTTGWLLSSIGVWTIISVSWSKPLLRKLAANKLALMGCCCYALGSLGFMTINHIYWPIFIYSALLGVGWGFFYTAAPSILSKSSADKNISTYFAYLSAFTVLGAGLAPVILKKIWNNNIEYNYVFFCAFCIALLAAVNFYLIGKGVSLSEQLSTTKPGATDTLERSKKNWNIKVIYIYLMVCLGACAYTMLLNYQITFSDHIGQNYAYFYLLFSATVVMSRLSLGKQLAMLNQNILVIGLLMLMVASLFSFKLSAYGLLFYGGSSVLFGLSYGLVYPTIQALAVKMSPIERRTDTISNFTLFYFIGVYAFPPLGGLVIVHLGYDHLLNVLGGLSGLEWLLSLLLIL